MLMTDVRSNKNQPVEDFISIAKAVRYSGYSEQYLRRLARRGSIRAIKFGHFWMVHVESLQAYLERASRLNRADKRFGPREAEE
jgi:excisionase family DNA binding protein